MRVVNWSSGGDGGFALGLLARRTLASAIEFSFAQSFESEPARRRSLAARWFRVGWAEKGKRKEGRLSARERVAVNSIVADEFK